MCECTLYVIEFVFSLVPNIELIAMLGLIRTLTFVRCNLHTVLCCSELLLLVLHKAQIPLLRLPETCPWHVSLGCFGKVGDFLRGSCRRGSCYREVMGKFRGFKPSWHVEMVWKIPVTSWQPARLRWGNGEIGDVHDKTRGSRQQTNGDVADVTEKLA